MQGVLHYAGNGSGVALSKTLCTALEVSQPLCQSHTIGIFGDHVMTLDEATSLSEHWIVENNDIKPEAWVSDSSKKGNGRLAT